MAEFNTARERAISRNASPPRTTPLGERSPHAIANTTRFNSGIRSLDSDQAWNQYAPNYGNLPDKYKEFEGNTGTPIRNLPFNINKEGPNLKWIQEPMDKHTTIAGRRLYPGKPLGYYPPFVPRNPTGYKGDPENILMNMSDLRDMGEMDFLGNMEQIYRMEDPSMMKTRPDLFETPGRQMEGIPQDYSHITDYYDYLNTLPVDQLQGIESLINAARLNAARDKEWWSKFSI